MAFKAVLNGGNAAWADEVENEEQTKGAPLPNISDFPSLEAAKVQPAAKKKVKAQKMTFSEFVNSGPSASAFQDKELRDKAILAQLPTASRGIKEEGRPAGALGGAFTRDYGDRPERGFGRREDGDRPPRRGEEDMGPSRADQADDWGSMRKFTPSEGPSGRSGFGGPRDRDGGFGAPRDGPREFRPSAADQTDNWGREKRFEPSAPGPRGGFGDDRRTGFADGPDRRPPAEPSRADVEDQWGRGREYKPADSTPAGPRAPRGPSADAPSVADREDRWTRRGAAPAAADEASSSGQQGASERPRLKLQPRSVPVGADAAGSGAGGSKSNPFGAARPREEVLKEKGIDPVKEQLKLEHGDVQRDETEEEKALKADVEALQKQLEDLKASDADADLKPLQEQLDDKEKELYKLQAQLDDAVRFRKGQERKDKEGQQRQAAPAAAKEGEQQQQQAPPAKARW